MHASYRMCFINNSRALIPIYWGLVRFISGVRVRAIIAMPMMKPVPVAGDAS